jgi:hypothetical protein
MWYYRCDRCNATVESFEMLWLCNKPRCRGQLRVERSELWSPKGDNDVVLGTGGIWDRATTDAMTNRALNLAFEKIKELSGGSVLRADFTPMLRRKDHYGKTATAEWATRVFDDLLEDRTVRKVEFTAEVSIDMSHVPRVEKNRLEFRGPDKPHVGWDLTRKVLTYERDGSEKVLRKDEAIVGHIILDDVPVFRPVQKREVNRRDEVLRKDDLKLVDKRKHKGAALGQHG